MEVTILVILVVATLLLLLASETPVAFALAFSGALGLLLLQSLGYATNVIGSVPFTTSHTYSLTIIPMFILLGMFAVHGRLAEQVYRLANHLFRRFPGGLAAATVMACAGFAAVSGSSVATAATMARLSIKEMVAYGYPKSFAAGTVAAAGTLGAMIPPSVFLVLYAILTGVSTGAMLAAGIVPGIISAILYIAYILWRGRRLGAAVTPASVEVHADSFGDPEGTAPVAAADQVTVVDGVTETSTNRPVGRRATHDGVEAPGASPLPWRGLVRVIILFSIVMGGIYTGTFTATESGALGALAALIMLIIELRRESPAAVRRAIASAFKESAQTTSMVFAIVVGSAILTAFFVASRVPQTLANWAVDLPLPPLLIVGILLLAMIPLGMALESISILVIAMPLVFPVVTALGFDGVWFGILTVKMIEIGLITPPVGISAYVVAGAASDVTVEEVFRGITPFFLVDLVTIAILFAFPAITLWLPGMIS